MHYLKWNTILDKSQGLNTNHLKAGANKKTLLRKQKCVLDAKNAFGKFHKHFLLPRCKFCLHHLLRGGTNEEWLGNHWRNTDFECFPNVSSFAVPKQHILKAQNLRLGSKNVFASFPFAHSCNIVSNIDSRCFCSNVSSFAPTFSLHIYSMRVILISYPCIFICKSSLTALNMFNLVTWIMGL